MIRIPTFLHDVFGETQTVGEILAVLGFGVGVGVALFLAFPEMTAGLPFWRWALAGLLMVDIASGCIANFTHSTNQHYAVRPKARLVFIAIHIHLPVLAALLGVGLGPAWVIWAYTVVGAFLVNALTGQRLQIFVAGTLLCAGLAGLILSVEAPKYFLLMAALFMIKVLYSFAVDHYGQAFSLSNSPDAHRE